MLGTLQGIGERRDKLLAKGVETASAPRFQRGRIASASWIGTWATRWS